MMIRKLYIAALALALLWFQVAPPAIAAYNGPSSIGAMTGDCTAPAVSNAAIGQVTTCSKLNGQSVGSNAYVNTGYEGGDVSVTTGSTYSTGTADQFICVKKTTGSATGITLTLPGSVPAGQVRVWKIKDCKGDAATNNITVTPSSGTVDGQASFVLTNNYQYNEFRYDGTTLSVE